MNRSFSRYFEDAAIIGAIVAEMAASDHWESMDECLARDPDRAELYTQLAHAALRAMRKMEDLENNLRPSQME